MTGAQAPYAHVPLADGTLVPTEEMPSPDQIPHMQAVPDVLGPGDGAVGLTAGAVSRMRGTERIIAMSRHPARQKLILEYGATHIVAARGAEGTARCSRSPAALALPTRGKSAASAPLSCCTMSARMRTAPERIR